MFNYLGILHKSSSISHSIKCNFLENEQCPNLVISKGSILEIYKIGRNGLEPKPYLNIYGNIKILEAVPSSVPNHDNLLLVTEDLEYSIISHFENKIGNIKKGTLKEEIGRKLDEILYSFDESKEVMVINVYKNLFKVIYLKNKDQISDYSVRYDYENILFIFPLFSCLTHTCKLTNTNKDCYIFGALKAVNFDYENVIQNISGSIANENSNLILDSFSLLPDTQDIDNNYHNQHKKTILYDFTSNPLITYIISSQLGYIIIFFSNYVTYYTYNHMSNNKIIDSNIKVKFSERKIVTHCLIDAEKGQYLVIDDSGNLYLLVVNNNIIFQFLGEVNYASSLTYLDNNYFFVASETANSQLIKVLQSPNNNNKTNPFLDIVEEYESLAPITDFAVINNSKEENSVEILTVSGCAKTCSIKSIRKGTSLNIEGDIPIKGIKSVFLIKYESKVSSQNNQINVLILSPIYGSTILLDVIGSYDILIHNKIKIDFTENCLFASNCYNSHVLIITTKGIKLYNKYLEPKSNYNLDFIPLIFKLQGKGKTLYTYNDNKTLTKINLFSKSANKFNIETILKNEEISAFDASEYFVIYSKWDTNEVNIISLRTKQTNLLIKLDEQEGVQISSIIIMKKEGCKYVFISTSSGKMYYLKLKEQFRNLKEYNFTKDDFIYKRKYNISDQTFNIYKSRISQDNSSCLFLNTVIPALIYFNNENLIISNFNIKNCKNIFKTYNNNYVFVFDDNISFGMLSNTQSQNVISKKFGNNIYNLKQIRFDNNTCLLGFILEEKNPTCASFVLTDFNLRTISSYKCESINETCCTFSEMFYYTDRKFIILGTGKEENENEDPILGHLYLLEIYTNNYKIKKISEIETKGGVYTVLCQNNSPIIYVAIGSCLYIYKLIETGRNFEFKLIRKNNDFNIINNLSFFDGYLIVSEIYRSISLFSFDEEKDKLTEICRDFNPTWMYSTVQCNSGLLYSSDIDGNIISFNKETHPQSDEQKYKLERRGWFNLGERVNKMNVTQILAKNLKDIAELNNNDELTVTYFATFEGSIGIMIQLKKEIYEFLLALQKEILSKIQPNGNFNYDTWRAFKDGYINTKSSGFIEGSILSEFLLLEDEYKKDLLEEMNYPWKKSVEEISYIIETLHRYH